jgi:hypothetical protein
MGNFIFGYNFPTPTLAASSNYSTDYSISNANNWTNLRRKWMSSDTSANTITGTFDTTQAVVGVVLDDVNFTSCTIGGTSFTVSKDERVNRYKIYAVKSSSGTSAPTIVINNQATTDGLSTFRIGRIIYLTSIITLTQNISWNYPYTAEQPSLKIPFESGGAEILRLGDYFAFSCTMKFEYLNKTNESQIHTINTINMNTPIVLYENNSDTSKVYVCYKDGGIGVTELSPTVVSIDSFKFMEYI